MPKTSNEGPTYAGLVDVSPPETATPEWVPADSDEAKAAAATDEKSADDKSDEDAKPAAVSRETAPSKLSAKSDDGKARKGRG
jgi:hypothetical protein